MRLGKEKADKGSGFIGDNFKNTSRYLGLGHADYNNDDDKPMRCQDYESEMLQLPAYKKDLIYSRAIKTG